MENYFCKEFLDIKEFLQRIRTLLSSCTGSIDSTEQLEFEVH